MNRQHTVRILPAPPEFRNSAGRLLRLVQMLNSNSPYLEVIAGFYQDNKTSLTTEDKGQLYLKFMQIVSSTYEEFCDDIELTESMPDATRRLLVEGLSTLTQIVYPINLGNRPRSLQDAETSLLRLAGSMLPEDGELADDDRKRILESIER